MRSNTDRKILSRIFRFVFCLSSPGSFLTLRQAIEARCVDHTRTDGVDPDLASIIPTIKPVQSQSLVDDIVNGFNNEIDQAEQILASPQTGQQEQQDSS